MANARDFDGTALSAAHIGPALADMYGAMKDNSPTLAKGTAVMTLVDGTPDLDGNVDITGTLTVATGATVTAGGMTITAGGATITAGGLTHVDGNVGFWGATPVAQASDMGALTDSTGGSTPNGTLSPVGDTQAGDESGPINDNFRELLEKVNDIRTVLQDLGLMA